MRKNLSRRGFVQQGLAASAVCTSSGIPRIALGLEVSPTAAEPPVLLRKLVITAAALQWLPLHHGFSRRSIESDLLSQLRALTDQVSELDLIVVSRPGNYSADQNWGLPAALKDVARQSKCHLVLPAAEPSEFLVVNAFGETTRFNAGVAKTTEIGTIAISTKAEDTSIPDLDVDIRIRHDMPGYDREAASTSAAETKAYTMVVTSPVNQKTKRSSTGSALYCPMGSTLTETDGRWNQAIVSVFHIADWRRRRSEESARMPGPDIFS